MLRESVYRRLSGNAEMPIIQSPLFCLFWNSLVGDIAARVRSHRLFIDSIRSSLQTVGWTRRRCAFMRDLAAYVSPRGYVASCLENSGCGHTDGNLVDD